jgi:hypothetical protein
MSQYELSKVGFPIRKFPDQSLFAAPQNISQRTTSFIASLRLGIHRMLLRHLIVLMIDARIPEGITPPIGKTSYLPNIPGTTVQALKLVVTGYVTSGYILSSQ